MKTLPAVQTLEQAREILNEMQDGQEISAESGESEMSLKKHNDHEYAASLPDLETGIISLRDASHILLEHGDHEMQLN